MNTPRICRSAAIYALLGVNIRSIVSAALDAKRLRAELGLDPAASHNEPTQDPPLGGRRMISSPTPQMPCRFWEQDGSGEATSGAVRRGNSGPTLPATWADSNEQRT